MAKRVYLAVLLCLGPAVRTSAQAHEVASARTQGLPANSEKKSSATMELAPMAGKSIPTDPNLKVAFIGDAGVGAHQRAVLNLIKSEGAQAVLHQGDFDYHDDPTEFWTAVNNILGANFPYFVSVGNHDVGSWPTTRKPSYGQYLYDRMKLLGLTPDNMELNNEMYSFIWKGLKIVYVGEQRGVGDRVYAPYIKAQLKDDKHIWRVCGWHRNMNAMQMGDKPDDMGWGVYEACREYGAIIATAHEHSYERTKTLTSISGQTVDPEFSDPGQLAVGSGKTFVFISGLGGESIRVQRRCLPATPPYGCKGEWAKIYTSNQNAQYGALFITFNINGDPNKAHGYFKNIAGQIVDEFNVTKNPSLQ